MTKNNHWRFSGNELKYIKNVLDTGFSAGKSASMNEKLEKKFAKIHNQKYSITANSGTSTLHMALDALNVGHGDEVIVPSLTVAMCGYAVWHCGATPVFCDVDEKTFLIDPIDIQKKITNKTKAIMVVHLYGLMCDMTKIMKISKKYKIPVIEDCAQCFLGKDELGRISGTIGSVGSWSFETTKHITTGDGGIVTTNNENYAISMRKLNSAGYKNLKANSGKIRIHKDKFQDPNWVRHDKLSYNYRLSEICAAVGLAQLERLRFFVKKRNTMGKLFLKTILKTKTKLLTPQFVPKKFYHSYFTFAAKFNGLKFGIKWQDFRKKFIEFGGDGIYAAWKILPEEGPFSKAMKKGLRSGQILISKSYGRGETPMAKKIQKNIMQFTTNQKNKFEMKKQINALKKTISFFNL
ncbi:DegT/DnrJ/EryC1/StrS family aminotransferase [Candidatus Pelagibacter ubique]|nr:DegT/DnrJ/EryC1/StrS family aminotransferase [Candidatus Pelagibacter ubique]